MIYHMKPIVLALTLLFATGCAAPMNRDSTPVKIIKAIPHILVYALVVKTGVEVLKD